MSATAEQHNGRATDRLLATLEQLLALPVLDLGGALNQASSQICKALDADKTDIFLYDRNIDSLVAAGTSDTPMGRLQRDKGLDRLPIANGGRMVEVYQTGKPYITGRADEDSAVLPGFTAGLGIRSMLGVTFVVAGEQRGVLHVASLQPDFFTADDLQFVTAVAQWVGMVAHRAELIERTTAAAAEEGRRTAAEELITVLAHDLGNYLTPLQARIDLHRLRAKRENRSRDVQDATEMTAAVQRLQRLIGNLLDATRLEQGIFTLSLQPVDLVSLARQVAGLLSTPNHQILVESPDELVAEADPDRLLQALENLVSNALKHGGDDPVHLHVTTENRDGRHWAVLSVRDEGPGISPDVLPRIFARFGSSPDSTGLGLGLYLARGIAEAHGGRLVVQSMLGQGAAFHFSFPLQPSAR